MTRKIALGVLLGNIMFALLAWVVIDMEMKSYAADLAVHQSEVDLQRLEQKYGVGR